MKNSKGLSVVILAAGKGKRMKSDIPKVLHKICDQPILSHVLSTVMEIDSENRNIFVVVGYKAELVENYVRDNFPDVKVVRQEEQLGTAHAVLTVKEYENLLDENVIVLNGDSPLLTSDILNRLWNEHTREGNVATITTAILQDPTGYGRIIRDGDGNILEIVEEVDATEKEKEITEVNASIYCFNTKILFENIIKIKPENSQREYYLTDIVRKLVETNHRVGTMKLDPSESWQVLGINDRIQLSEIEKIIQSRINEKLMREGVTIRNPQSCYIGASVKIEKDVIIEPFCFIKGNSIIEKNCVIGPFCQIDSSVIGSGSTVNSSVILDSIIGRNNTIGPYSYIRPGTITGENVKIGAFCEIKKSKISERSKIPHLSYVGDSEIGSNVNVGASTVTVNYDGYKKHKTIIEDNVFI
ncbi:MAG: bifunctional UDP-N-acetylglucosamine diphosphorylase/glucosamine-1-phosphate N-acetyltransferase GlmU, partial [Actinobacteria bacterium]|nr:bifunctional UDP-N-acetylglucosamine diphosphorylase/glucosamine-1-phosphate N-acetyltransferase GlmU [Actinomycetota bacterium]